MSDTGPSFTEEEREALSDLHRRIAEGSHAGGQILEEAAMILDLIEQIQIQDTSAESTILALRVLENRLKVLGEMFFNLSVA